MDHDTPWPDGSLFAVAVIGSMLPAWTAAVVGDTETVIAETMMVADPDLAVSVDGLRTFLLLYPRFGAQLSLLA